jgi:hypothetical protein
MRWIVPETVRLISINHQQFEAGPLQAVDKKGDVITIYGIDVPDHLDADMKSRNYIKVTRPEDRGKRPADPPSSPSTHAKPPVDPKTGLRLDGPTLEEWLKEGYQATAYPPKGFADKRTDDELAESEAALRAADEAKRQAEQQVLAETASRLDAMTFDQLGTWLIERGVKAKGLTDKASRLKAAYDFIGYEPPAEPGQGAK